MRPSRHAPAPVTSTGDESPSPVVSVEALGRPWRGVDPFLFCMHHVDHYPAGNGQLGVDGDRLEGREIGMDFSGQDGWSMYHGEEVPGFPGHPHRGFETITVVPRGLVDHADSLGGAARYGDGDVQWMTAGRGIQHGEMFPLVHDDADNVLDLFQIWLNLPAASKMVAPYAAVFWSPTIARVRQQENPGHESEVEVIAGDYAPVTASDAFGSRGDRAVNGPGPTIHRAPTPPPDSWASQAEADVAIWRIRLDPGARLTLPAARSEASRRVLYFHQGTALGLAGETVGPRRMIEVRAGQNLPLANLGDDVIEILMLQGRPIGEPVAARGPFVMNTAEELVQAMRDYAATRFGGWPWPDQAPTHGRAGRFARHPDGRTETP